MPGGQFNNPKPVVMIDVPVPPIFRKPVVGYTVTQEYSYDPVTKKGHKGIDLYLPEGSPVVAGADGIVLQVQTCSKCKLADGAIRQQQPVPSLADAFSDPAWGFGFGNFITVMYPYSSLLPGFQLWLDANGYGKSNLYAVHGHLKRLDAWLPGHVVRAGDVLGWSGQTGNTTGPHLHWELRLEKSRMDFNYFMASNTFNPRRLVTL